MISTFKEYTKLFEEIDAKINQDITIYVIGGAVMLYYDLKTATKDIDLVVQSSKEFQELNRIFKASKFVTKIPEKEYENFDLSQIYERSDIRIDLFENTVCKGFALTESMKKRAKEVLKLQHISVKLCSTTDIFMFKTFTERDGDIQDCIALAKLGIEWSDMLDEINAQIALSKKPVWITYIGERLDLLVDKELEIPIMKEIDKLRIEYYKQLEEKLK